jgi:NTP pyrophosphatase (non-canonical NTP hydrolase)
MDPLPYQKIREGKRLSYLEATQRVCEAGELTHDHAIELAARLDEAERRLSESSIGELVKSAHQNAVNKGWYEEPRTFGDMIALIHSELSEALEDYRIGHNPNKVWYEGKKPCGIPIELADACIRIFDMCGYFGIDLEKAIREKMAYNATRPQRHGGKRI